MYKIAESREGKCLSRKYVNNHLKLKWKCGKCDNIWNATYASISLGHWCPKCGHERTNKSKIKYTIKDLQTIARERGGKCLSGEYNTPNAKILWQCGKGHIWETRAYKVLKGSWCKRCTAKKSYDKSRRLSIEWFKNYAQKKGGRCISTEYENPWSIMSLECKEGHRWETTARNLRRGSWCHICGGSNPLAIDVFERIARERGGECLSTIYRNARQKLEFRCENGHIFKKDAAAVRNTSQWCPECVQNTGERICRVAFENIFRVKFDPAWPEWLRNSRNQPMELDGYNEELKVAFEHQGEQHYSTISHWIKTKEKLRRRKRDDRKKYYLARKNGVHLFRIPQVPQRISPDNLIPYIAIRAIKRGIAVPVGWNILKIDFNKVYHVHSKERIEYCKALAAQKGGAFLSTEWRGEESYYTWRCSSGHQWSTKVRSIRTGNWCRYCSGKAKRTIEDFQNIAKEKGGECLSRHYISAHEKLKFICREGHIFYSSGSNVKNLGRWCPECSGKKKHTLKEMQKLAKTRKGKFLSNVYESNKAKLLWECEKGHQWMATPKKILQGQWCPQCGKMRIWEVRRANLKLLKVNAKLQIH